MVLTINDMRYKRRSRMGVEKDAAHIDSKLSHMGLELRKGLCWGEAFVSHQHM